MVSEAEVNGASLHIFPQPAATTRLAWLLSLVLALLSALVFPAGLSLQDCTGAAALVTLQFELCVLEAQTAQILPFLRAFIH